MAEISWNVSHAQASTDGDVPASDDLAVAQPDASVSASDVPAADQTAESDQPADAAPQATISTDGDAPVSDDLAVAQPEAPASASDVPAADQTAESNQPANAAPQAPKSLEERAKSVMDDFQLGELGDVPTWEAILEDIEDAIRLMDQRLQAAARKKELSDRELLVILNEKYNNEENDGAVTPCTLSADEYIANKSNSGIFGEGVQITTNLASNIEGVR
jgi:hypothetical protein